MNPFYRMSSRLTEKILFVLPDYNHTTIRSLRLFQNLGWDVTIMAPFNYKIF